MATSSGVNEEISRASSEPLLGKPENKRRSNSSSSSKVWLLLKKVGNLFADHFNSMAIVLGPVAFVLLLVFVKLDEDSSDTKKGPMLASMVWMFIWWVTEAIPLCVTALLPLFLFPFLEIETASTVSKSYTNDTIFLILGSFILADAVRSHNLHKRFAIQTVLLFQNDPRFLLFGFSIGSAFISMWIDNSAACAMLMPVVIAVQQKVHAGFQNPHGHIAPFQGGHGGERKLQIDDDTGERDEHLSPLEKQTSIHLEKHLSTVLSSMDVKEALDVETKFCHGAALCVVYAVTIGGMATITGNAVNMVFVGLWETEFPKETDIYYLQWMLFAFPLSFLLTLASWIIICIFYCPPSAVKPVSASLQSLHMEDELAKMGPMTSDQISILGLFFILIALWMTKSFGGQSTGWASLFNDYPGNGSITIFVAMLLFVIPNLAKPNEKLLTWSQCKEIPWNVILLLGGGFALADGINNSGLSDLITEEMSFLESAPYWAITPAISIVVAIVTEFTSNSGTASVFIPLCAQIALSIGRHPLFLMVPATISSQFSYMFPTGTATNAMAFAVETLRTRDMAKPGIFLKIVAILLLSILMPTLGVVVFNTNSTVIV